MKLGRKPLCAVLISLTLFASACGAENEPRSQLETLKVVATTRVSNGPIFIADELGFFKEQGIDIEYVPFEISSDALPVMAQGKIDVFSGSASFALINAIKKTGEIKVVADKGNFARDGCADAALLAKPSIDFTAESLRGKTIQMDSGSITEYIVSSLLARVGLTPADVKVADVEDSAVPQALAGGALDVAHIQGPAIEEVLANGGKKLIETREVLPEFQSGTIAYGPKLLEGKPDLGRRFMIGFLKGVREWRRGKTDRNVEIVARITDESREIVRKACWTSFRTNGHISWPTVDALQKWAHDHDQVDTLLTEGEFWTPEFVDYAKENLD